MVDVQVINKNDLQVSVGELRVGIDLWIMDCEFRQFSPRTMKRHKMFTGHLLWWVEHRGLKGVGRREMQEFFLYVRNGDGAKRWGSEKGRTTVSAVGTVRGYLATMRTFFKYLEVEGHITVNPMAEVKAPVGRQGQIQPFSPAQVNALIKAASGTHNGKRDVAIVQMLLDTAMRCNELTNLKIRDLDLPTRKCMVWGKGGKARSVYFGAATAKSLLIYIRASGRTLEDVDSPVFIVAGGVCGIKKRHTTQPMGNAAVLALMHRLGKAAGVSGVRCSVHTWRHTSAVMFLRNGGNVFTLKEILGHTNLNMTSRYVALAEADVANQHRLYSPVDGIRGK